MLELCNHISAYIFCNSSTSKKPFSLPSSCPHLMMMMMIYLKPNFTTKNQGYNRAQLIQSSLKFCPDGCDSPALRGAGVLFGYCFCVVNSEFLLLLIPPNRQEGGGGGGEVLVRAQEQPARGGTKLWRLPRLPDVPSGTQAPPPQFNCRPRHRRRQQQLNPLGSTPPSSQRLKWAPDLLQPLQRGDATHHLAAPPPSLKHPCHLRLSLFVSKTSKRKCAS
jgi:hypothetical protein